MGTRTPVGRGRVAVRAAEILELVSARPGGLTGAALARQLGVPRSSVHDLLAALMAAGYLERRGRGLWPGLRLRVLAAHLSEDGGEARIGAVMRELARDTGAHVTLWVREGEAAVLVAVAGTSGWRELPSAIGYRLPLGQDAPGRVLRHAAAAGAPAPRAARTRAAAPSAEEPELATSAHAGPADDGQGHGGGQSVSPRIAVAVDAVDAGELQRWGIVHGGQEGAAGFYTLAVPVAATEQRPFAPSSLALTLPASRLAEVDLQRMEQRLLTAAAQLTGRAQAAAPRPRRRIVGRQLRVGWSMARMHHCFYAETFHAATRWASALGLHISWTNAREHPEKQAIDVERLLQLDPDLLIVHPVHAQAAADLFERLDRRGIPSICFQRPCRAQVPLTFVGGDTYQAGRMQIQALSQMLQGQGTVLLVGGDPDNINARNLAQAWQDASLAHPGLQVYAETMIPGWSPQRAVEWVAEHLALDGLRGIVAGNDEMGLAIATYARQRGRDVVVVGADGDLQALQYMRSGARYATVFQDPHELCRRTLHLAADLLRGRLEPSDLPECLIIHGIGKMRAHAVLVPYALCTQESHASLASYWEAILADSPPAAGVPRPATAPKWAAERS